MSEATSPKEQPTPELPVPSPDDASSERPPRRNGSGTGLAVLALLVGLGGAGAGGWSLWQLQGLEARDRQQAGQLDAVRGEAADVARQAQRLDGLLERLPTAEELDERRRLVARLQGDQQLLNQRLETALGASRQDWRLAEAEHLLRLASLRLSALQDVNSARFLVQAADEIVRDQDDPASFAAREQLALSLEALRSTPTPDRTGLFLQLGALRQQATQLKALNPTFQGQDGVLADLAEKTSQGWWRDTLATLSEYVRLDFDADQNVRPLLAGQSLAQVQLALSLALEQAQWAALHGQTSVYRQSLAQASDVLSANFNAQNPESRAMLARVGELVDQPIEVRTPDLSPSLTALQAYIEAKLSARDRAESGVRPAPEAAAPAGDRS